LVSAEADPTPFKTIQRKIRIMPTSKTTPTATELEQFNTATEEHGTPVKSEDVLVQSLYITTEEIAGMKGYDELLKTVSVLVSPRSILQSNYDSAVLHFELVANPTTPSEMQDIKAGKGLPHALGEGRGVSPMQKRSSGHPPYGFERAMKSAGFGTSEDASGQFICQDMRDIANSDARGVWRARLVVNGEHVNIDMLSKVTA
jgi:hypothetical protein